MAASIKDVHVLQITGGGQNSRFIMDAYEWYGKGFIIEIYEQSPKPSSEH